MVWVLAAFRDFGLGLRVGFGALGLVLVWVVVRLAFLLLSCGAAGVRLGAWRRPIGSIDAVLDLALFRGSGGFLLCCCFSCWFVLLLLECFDGVLVVVFVGVVTYVSGLDWFWLMGLMAC